jgi:hypothetical protein
VVYNDNDDILEEESDSDEEEKMNLQGPPYKRQKVSFRNIPLSQSARVPLFEQPGMSFTSSNPSYSSKPSTEKEQPEII